MREVGVVQAAGPHGEDPRFGEANKSSTRRVRQLDAVERREVTTFFDKIDLEIPLD